MSQEPLIKAIKRLPTKTINNLRSALLAKWEKENDPIVILRKEKKDYPFFYFIGIICEDWLGLGENLYRAISGNGINIETVWALTLPYKEKKIAISIFGIEIKDKNELDYFNKIKNKLTFRLYRGCIKDLPQTTFVSIRTQKLNKYEAVIKFISCHHKMTDRLIAEATKFFLARDDEYLEKKETKHLANSIMTNFTFIKRIREYGQGLQIKVEHIKEENITGITIACYQSELSLVGLLEILKEIIPNCIVAYNKEFVTYDGIAVYRVEIAGLHPIKQVEKSITKKIENKKFEKQKITELSGGFEQYWKAIIPKLIKDFEETKVPQVYIVPEYTTPEFIKIKNIVVKKSNSNWIEDYISKLEKKRGFTILTYELQKLQDYEINNFDLKIDSSIIKSGTVVYNWLKKILEGCIGKFRDFTISMRTVDITRFNKVKNIFKNHPLLNEIYYGIDNFYRLTTEEKEIIELVRLGINLLKEPTPKFYITEFDNKCNFIGIKTKEKKILPSILKILPKYKIIVNRIPLGEEDLLLLRITKDDKSLLPQEIREIEESVLKII